MIKDGSLERYYDVTEWVSYSDNQVRPINLSIFTNDKSLTVSKDPVTIDFECTSWGQLVNIEIYGLYSGYDLIMALIAILQHSVELVEVSEIKEKIRKSLEFLKNNTEEINNVIRSIKIVIPLLRNYVEKLKREAEEDKKLWEKLKVKEIATEEEENTMVSPASVYLTESSKRNTEGNTELIEKIREGGKLIRTLRLHNSFNAIDYIYIYEYNNEYYAIRTYEFSNLQGYTYNRKILYKIEEGFID